MVTLVTGGSGSGKSAYAETLLSSCEGMKFYIATMQVYDAEGEKKVERHRKLREGKGFLTIESPVDVGKIEVSEYQSQIGKMRTDAADKKSALLECMSNLAANEMFTGEGVRSADQVADKIINDIQLLSQKTDNLIIVTNNVFEDGIVYDASTMEYLRALGSINVRLAERSDVVVEVIAGIPVARKGELPVAAAEKQGHRQKGAPACP